MVTQRSILLGFVGGCFYLITLVNTLPSYYYALTWLAVGLLASALGLALLSLVGLDCQCSMDAQAVVECVPGEECSPAVVNVVLANRGSFSKTGLLLELLLRSDGGARPAGSRVTQRFVVEALPSGTHVASQLPLSHLPRGQWHVERVRLVGTDVLGLFRTTRRVPFQGEEGAALRVAPSVLETGSGRVWHNGAAGKLQGSMDSRYRVGQGEDLRGVRPYVPGDDMRRVHWKSTARAGELVVKEYHHRGRTASAVVWDGAAGTDWAGGLATEWCLRLVNSLHHSLINEGSPCDLLLCGQDTQAIPHGLVARAGFAPSHEGMTMAVPNRENPLTAAAGHLSQEYREIYLVTASVGPDVLNCVRGWLGGRARVTVLLVNGAALYDGAMPPRIMRRGRESDRLQQPVWTGSSTGSGGARMQRASSGAFASQWEALAQAGAHVVQVLPLEEIPLADYGPPLREALQMALRPGERHGKDRNVLVDEVALPVPGNDASPPRQSVVSGRAA